MQLSFRDNYHGYRKEIKIQLTFEQHRLKMHAPTYRQSFSTNIQSALFICRFYIQGFNQLQMENSIFNPWLGIRRCGGPIMYCSIPFYARDLSIHRFWYLCRVLKQIPHRYWGTIVKFPESQKLHSYFQLQGVEDD